MKYITASQIIQINASITGVEPDANKQVKINSVFSSVDYYDTVEEQIACIVLAIIKNHYFIDDNKRTALFVYLTLCVGNDIEVLHTAEQLASIMINLASHKYDVAYATTLLF